MDDHVHRGNRSDIEASEGIISSPSYSLPIDKTGHVSTMHIDPSAEEISAVKVLGDQLSSDPSRAHRLVRRHFETKLAPDPRVSIVPGAGQATSQTLGPFVDPSGRSIAIDVIKPLATPLIGIQRVATPEPFLYFSAGSISGTLSTIALSAGSIWCPAPQFSISAPASSFMGLQIQSGEISFSTPVNVGTSPIVISSGIAVTLVLKLVAASANGLVDNASARTPLDVSFSFNATGSSVLSADNSSLSAFGTTTKLSFEAASALYDTIFDRLLFPLLPANGSFSVVQSTSTFAKFSGSAKISMAAWSVPLTIANPATLGSAVGAGGISLSLAAGIEVSPTSWSKPIECGPCILLVDSSMLAVGGIAATAPNSAQNVGLYDFSSLTLRITQPSRFRYISEPTDIEYWAIAAILVATLDQPRTVNNSRVRFSGSAIFVLGRNGTSFRLSVDAVSSDDFSPQSYAIKNLLLLASDPHSIMVTGVYNGNTVTTGTVSLGFNLASIIPFLPDPYTTNFDFAAASSDREKTDNLTMILTWQPGEQVVINITLPSSQTNFRPAQSGQASRAKHDEGTMLEQVKNSATLIRASEITALSYLDLSTNVSQFGVLIDTQSEISLSVSNLYLQAPAATLGVITLPAVQWEPVVTDPNPSGFPSPLIFANSGQSFVMATKSVTLVPIAPRQALDGMIAAYNSKTPQETATQFTLPFGIVATASLIPSVSPFFGSPGLQQVQPAFTTSNLIGGDQISITAPISRLIQPIGETQSPSLQGSTTLLQNALHNGASTKSTVISPVDGAFNPTFGTGGSNACVPVTRIDISGFGESTFSDWRNSADDAATISKVNFNVMLGRTSREVVQLYSVKYCWGVRVVRTITIDRQNSGIIVRSDSGWQSVTNGTYQYPKAGITTHPGVVLGITNVTNIRDTGSTYTTPDGSQLMGVKFDCGVLIENVVKGAGADGLVPARDLIGYVQLTDRTTKPPLGQLADDQYADLINTVGSMGGPIDCVININKSGLLMKVTNIGVAPTLLPTSTFEFVMEARGAPILPAGGLWSFLSQQSANPSPEAIDAISGVPLVRRNSTTVAPITNYPYMFQNGDDLLSTSVETFYCLLHSTGTQRLIFPQPKIESTGAHEITSTVEPTLADPFVLGTATGPFCPINLCIPFNNSNYSLAISSSGDLTLNLPQPSFTTNVQPRILRDSKALKTIAYCSDENNNPSVVTVAINTASNTPWAVSITNMSLATQSGSLGEVVRVVGDISSDSQTPTQLLNSRLVFGAAIQPVQKVVSFLQQFAKLPAPAIAMTNDWQLQAGLNFNFQKYLMEVPELAAFLDQFIVDFDFKLLCEVTPDETSFDAEFELTVKFKTPFDIDVIALASFEIHMEDSGNTFIITLGAGLGVDFAVAGFDAIAYFAVTQSLIFGDTDLGLATGTLLKGSIDLKVVDIDLEIEASMGMVDVKCSNNEGNPADSIWGFAQVTIAVEVSIFALIDIGFSWQTEWTNNFNGGPCKLTGV